MDGLGACGEPEAADTAGGALSSVGENEAVGTVGVAVSAPVVPVTGGTCNSCIQLMSAPAPSSEGSVWVRGRPRGRSGSNEVDAVRFIEWPLMGGNLYRRSVT